MGTLGLVLRRLADPGWAELPAKAVALLEPLEPGPELVSALTEVAGAHALQGHHEAGLGYAERALTLAEELGLPRPARALGYRAMARSNLGDRGGLDDFREAIALATEAGQGREVALLHNNLAYALGPIDGPVAALEILQAGIAFAEARGLTEIAEMLTANSVETLVETGDHEQALALAGELAAELEASGDALNLTTVRSVQAQILTLRGQATQVADTLDWLEATTRESGHVDQIIVNLGVAARARAALGQNEQAAALLAEIEATPGSRENAYYPAYLPAMVRTALALGNLELAERLIIGVEPRTPYEEHALATASAALAEAHGDLEAAAAGYADAAQRWQAFGVVPEQAFALLGQGRCLTRLGRTSEASPVLVQAREIFLALQAAPALAETDELLQQATALSS